jgi:hypothetical protein
MQIELRCPACPCRFRAEPTTPADEVVEKMIDEGPWYALAEGATFEDMIFAALLRRGAIHCPECDRTVSVQEVSLGRHARQRFQCR